MGLENLKSIFTEGIKKMNNSDLSSMNSNFSVGDSSINQTNLSIMDTNINITPFSPPITIMGSLKTTTLDNIKNANITDIHDSLTKGRLSGDLSITDLPKIGAGGNVEIFNNFTSGNIADYQSMVYDPRISNGLVNISKNPYKGTRFTQMRLMGEAGSGIGGLFNTGGNINSLVHYSFAFRTINTPKGYGFSPDGSDIIKQGNLGTLSADASGGGYPTKQPLMTTYTSTRGFEPTLNKYFPSGNSDVNVERTIVKNEIPSFNNLTLGQGHTGTLSDTGLDLLSSPLAKKLSGTSWQDYYNANHTPKDDVGYHYSPFVDRDKLNIRDSNNVQSPDRGTEPYIINNIGDRKHNNSGRFRPFSRGKTDTTRLTRFIKSGAGISFFFAQNAFIFKKIPVIKKGGDLSRVSQRFGTIYNPLSTLAIQQFRFMGQSMNFKSDRKMFPSFFDYDTYGEQMAGDEVDFAGPSGSIMSFTSNNFYVAPVTKQQKEEVKKLTGAWSWVTGLAGGFFTNNDKLRNSHGDVLTMAPLVTHETDLAESTTVKRVPTLNDDGTLTPVTEQASTTKLDYENQGLPFYFKDLRDDTYVIFRAYIDSLTENISPSWKSQDYIGRSEPVYSYEQTERNLSFNLKLYAQNVSELEMIYTKMNRLTSMCYPQYYPDDDALVNSIAQIRQKSPLTRFRIGDIFGGSGGDSNMMLGFLKSITYTIPPEATWEIAKGKQVPKYVTAAINYQVMHETVPSYLTQFYGKQTQISDADGSRGGFAEAVPE